MTAVLTVLSAFAFFIVFITHNLTSFIYVITCVSRGKARGCATREMQDLFICIIGPMLTLIFISIIFLLAGFIQGLSGFGSALLAMPLLTLFVDVKTAVPLCILQSLLMTAYLSWKLRAFVERGKILPLIAGSLPGIYIGVTFLNKAEPALVQVLLGMLIVMYSTYSLVFKPAPRKVHRLWAYIAGFCTGFIGSAFSTGGPPAIIYTTLTGWSKDHIKATLSAFFFVTSVITVAAHAVSGLTNTLVLKYFSVSSLFVLLGVYGGSRLYDRIKRQGYIRIILATLIALGLMMIIAAFNNMPVHVKV